MAIWLKSPDEIEKMARAGEVLATVLRAAAAHIRPGMTTGQLDTFIQGEITSAGAEPVMLGYRGQRSEAPPFPGAASIGINEEVVHAVPGPRILREGDIATIDCALRLNGWCADMAIGVAVGQAGAVGAERRHLLAGARRVLEAAIGAARPGVWWSEVARAARAAAEAEGLWLVPDFAGHGIGKRLHEAPTAAFDEAPMNGGVPGPGGGPANASRSGAAGAASLDLPSRDFLLRPGMTLTVEPVLVPERTRTLGLDDGWTVVTANRSLAAHEERTIAVLRSGVRVLTRAD